MPINKQLITQFQPSLPWFRTIGKKKKKSTIPLRRWQLKKFFAKKKDSFKQPRTNGFSINSNPRGSSNQYNSLDIGRDWGSGFIRSIQVSRLDLSIPWKDIIKERVHWPGGKSNPFPAQIVHVLFKGFYVFVNR